MDEFYFTTYFFLAPYTSSSEVKLDLSNGSSDGSFIAFKVMAVDAAHYLVTPSNGIIRPGGSSSLKISLLALADAAEVKSFLQSKQKFLIKWCLVKGEPPQGVTARQILVNTAMLNHLSYF